MTGTTLGRYRILEEIGQGAMGQVYLAQDLRLSRKVAIKMLPPSLVIDETRRKRFEREARPHAMVGKDGKVMLTNPPWYRGGEAATKEIWGGRIGWLPCEQLDACPSIPANRAILVPLTEVYGWDDSAEVVQVNWWRMVPQLGRPEYRMVGIDVVAGSR